MERDINIELLNGIRSCSNIIKRSRQNEENHPQGYGRLMWAICNHDGMTQSQLADLLDIRPQSLTRALSDLEQKGLIERKRSPQDRRTLAVYATAEGIEYHHKMADKRQMRAQSIFSCLDEDEKETMCQLLDKLISFHNRSEEVAKS